MSKFDFQVVIKPWGKEEIIEKMRKNGYKGPVTDEDENRPIIFNNKSKLVVDSMRCKKLGPIITPDRIKPIIPGTRKRLNNNGEKRIISSISARIKTEFFKGKY